MQQDYKQLLSEVIKKQIVILGPDITLAKARNVQGLIVADDGTVTDISGEPQQITQKLIDQFVQLSGEIVKKTMEPLLSMNQSSPSPQSTPVVANEVKQSNPNAEIASSQVFNSETKTESAPRNDVIIPSQPVTPPQEAAPTLSTQSQPSPSPAEIAQVQPPVDNTKSV